MKRPAPRTRLLVTWGLGGVALVLAGVLALQAWRLTARPPAPAPAPADRGSGALTDEQTAARNQPMRRLTELVAIAPRLDAEPLDGAPASLAPPPGAQRLFGDASTDARRTVHRAAWSVAETTVGEVAAHYAGQVAARGYRRRRELLPDDPSVSHRLYERDGRLLTVRARQAGGVVRVVVQLRYTTGRSHGCP